jgi:ribosomal protein L19E
VRTARTPPQSASTAKAESLRELKKLKDDGTLTDAEYKAQKKKILDQGL